MSHLDSANFAFNVVLASPMFCCGLLVVVWEFSPSDPCVADIIMPGVRGLLRCRSVSRHLLRHSMCTAALPIGAHGNAVLLLSSSVLFLKCVFFK
jgi:hypothetical protein